MKIKLLVLSILIASLKIVAQQNSLINTLDIAEMEKKSFSPHNKSLNSLVVNNYDLKYHRCEWQVDPAVRHIQGKITSYFKPTVTGFNQIQFDLTDTLIVDSVKYHNTAITFNQSLTDILQINFPATIPINTLDSVSVWYGGTPAQSGFGAFNQTTHNSGTVPVIWTLSEPMGAKDWWPCKQDLVDKVDSVDIIVTVPQVNRVGSNGVLLSEDTVGTNKIYHWKTKYPIAAYLIAIAVTNYAYYSNYVPLIGGDSLQVLNYVYPEDLAVAQTQTPDIINVIKFYDSLTIEYPFKMEKYGHAEFGWGGGMEHQTMTFCINFGHSLIAHECAHQWFGDHVTCGSWQDIWLNEGFATFFEGLTEERFFPSTWYNWKKSKIDYISQISYGSVLCDDTTNVNRIFDGRLSYNKGSYLLVMLRWKLGDSVFFHALKNYQSDPLLAGGYAKTPDLKAHLESQSGQNLTSFFNEWYYNQGWPTYHLLWSQAGNQVTLTVNQTTSHPSVSFYEMPIPVKFFGAGHDTTIVFNHTFSGQVFLPTINFMVDSIQFDPDLHILSAFNTVTGIPTFGSLTNQINIYPNPTKTNITINIQLKNTDELTFEVFDVVGNKISSEKATVIAGSTLKTLQTEHLAAGEYIVKIKGKEINFSQKVLKQ